MPVHFSHSATVPVMVWEIGAGAMMVAPRRACVRSHGSSGRPSSRVQVMKVSIGVSG